MPFSACTVHIADTLNWVYAFIQGRPTQGVGGFAGEPGLTSANFIMGTIINAPFAWEWNRAEDTFTATEGVSDYLVNLQSFGYLEKAQITTGQTAPNPVNRELELVRVLAQDEQANPPQKISILLDDNAGNITFRLFPTPDSTQTVTITYQKAPITLAQGTDLSTTTWSPIPDKLSFIYEGGLLAILQGMYNAQLYFNGMELFYRRLVAAAEGLTDTEKALFLEERIRELRTQAAALGAASGRGR